MNAITNAVNTALNTSRKQQYHFDTNVIRDDPADVITGRNGSYGFSLAGKLTARIASHAIALVNTQNSPLVNIETGEIEADGIDGFNAMMSQLDALGAELEGEQNDEPHEKIIAGLLHARNLLKRRGVKVGSFVEHFKWRAEQALKSANDDAMIQALANESGLKVEDIRKARQAKGKGQASWVIEMATKAMQIIAKAQPDPMFTPAEFKDMYLESLQSARMQAVRNSNNLAEARATLLLLKACEERSDRQLPVEDDEPAHDVDADTVEFEPREDDASTPSYEMQLAELEDRHDRGEIDDDEYDALVVNLRGG